MRSDVACMHEAGRGLITRSSGKAVKGIVMKRVCRLAAYVVSFLH